MSRLCMRAGWLCGVAIVGAFVVALAGRADGGIDVRAATARQASPTSVAVSANDEFVEQSLAIVYGQGMLVRGDATVLLSSELSPEELDQAGCACARHLVILKGDFNTKPLVPSLTARNVIHQQYLGFVWDVTSGRLTTVLASPDGAIFEQALRDAR